MEVSKRLQLVQMSNRIRAEQRSRVARSLRAFAMLYLPHHVSKPSSRMHQELYPMLEALREQRGARIAVAAPRSSAKSTLVDTLFVLWAVCHKLFDFVVIISDTAEKAGGFLESIKHELVCNERLRADFPEVCEASGRYPRPPRWRRDEIVTHNGVRITALGTGQNIRGIKHHEHRPDLIILDDVESDENTKTKESRVKLSDWFTKSILKAGTQQSNLIVVGTITHYDSLLAKLTDPVKSPTWASKIYRSVIRWSDHPELWEAWAGILRKRDEFEDETGPAAARAYFDAHRDAMLEGTQVLWPEMEDYHALMTMRESDGPASFDSEKQNEPVNPDDCYFLEEDFRFWDDQFETAAELIAAIGRNAVFLGACDPSLGRQGRHADDSAIITLLRDTQTGTLYVLDADIARRKPDQIIETILTYQRMRKYQRFGFEVNQFQAFLGSELKRRSAAQGLYLPVEDIQNSSDKLGRIQGLQPLIRSGTLQFSRRQTQLLEQLRLFPKAAHDDGPDALEMAVATARSDSRSPTIEEWRECIRLNEELREMRESTILW